MVIEPSLERVREVRELLHGHFGAARLVEAQFLARRTGKCLRLKLETQLRTGSFRVRGAVWALAARLKRESIAGVVASSPGNHGAAVAWTERSQLLVSRVTGEVRTGTLLGQVLGGFRQVQTLQLIFSRSFSHSAGALARVFLMADSSIFEGNRLPHRGQSCGLSTPTRVALRGGTPERLEPACGNNSSGPSMKSYDILEILL